MIVEKRDRFSRNNVLHLWPYLITDLKNLGAKLFCGKFCAGSIDHISKGAYTSSRLFICVCMWGGERGQKYMQHLYMCKVCEHMFVRWVWTLVDTLLLFWKIYAALCFLCAGIRQLQCILLKVALLVGVEVHVNVSFDGLIEPSEDGSKVKIFHGQAIVKLMKMLSLFFPSTRTLVCTGLHTFCVCVWTHIKGDFLALWSCPLLKLRNEVFSERKSWVDIWRRNVNHSFYKIMNWKQLFCLLFY